MFVNKTCILTPEYTRKIGGVGTCIIKQVDLLGNENCDVISLDSTNSPASRALHILLGILRHKKFFIHGPYFLIIAAVISKIFVRKKFSLFFHGSEQEFIKNKSEKLFSVFLKLLDRKSDNIEFFFVSEYLKREYEAILKPDTLRDSRIIYFGPEYQDYKRHARQASVVHILTVSRVVRQKGLFDMVHAFAEMKDRERFFWQIVGDGPDLEELKSLIISLDLKNVECVGRKTKNQLKKFFQEADIFWLCSLYNEGLGLVYLEAASFDLPCVALRRGGVREAILHEKTGFLEPDVKASTRRISEYKDWSFKKRDFRDLCLKRRNFIELIK